MTDKYKKIASFSRALREQKLPDTEAARLIGDMAHELDIVTSSPTSELALKMHGLSWFTGEYREGTLP